MFSLIQSLGGPTAVARMLGISPPSVCGWRGRVPPDRCPAIERATDGKVTCEQLRADVHWVRVPDDAWPHPGGRPCIDVAAAGQRLGAEKVMPQITVPAYTGPDRRAPGAGRDAGTDHDRRSAPQEV